MTGLDSTVTDEKSVTLERGQAELAQVALADLDLAHPAFRADPYPTYARLRTEDPVVWNQSMGYWLMSRYSDVSVALRQTDVYSSASFKDRPVSAHDPANTSHARLLDAFGSTMIFKDPPEHTRLRKLVNRPFTPSNINRRRPELTELCRSLLESCRDRGDFDFVGNFAAPFPILVIADLMGVPVGDRDLIKELSYQFGILFEPMLPMSERSDALDASVRLGNYLDKTVAARRQSTGDDIVSALVQSQDRDDRLSADEMRGMLLHMLVAGNETSTSLMTHTILVFDRQPEVREAVRTGAFTYDACVDEVLRFDPPLQLVTRQVTRDVTVRGVRIPQGSLVALMIGAANRDEDAFVRPAIFDLTRENNNKYLSFGAGAHFCLGSILSRLEGEIATRLFVEDFPDMTVSPEQGVRRPDQMIRGYLSLPARMSAQPI